VIAADVDPIELVVWLPALCRKMKVPYAIVRSKAQLGQLVHEKKTTCIAFTSVKQEDKQEFDNIVKAADSQFAENEDSRRQWGGGIMGNKSIQKTIARNKIIAAERAGKSTLTA
jgi:large subunit ribosomal protein L7Ae